MTKALKIAERTGCSRVELASAFHRKQAHDFYDRLGFENKVYLFSKKLNTDGEEKKHNMSRALVKPAKCKNVKL